MKFKLQQIFESADAWRKLCALPKPALISYQTGKYFSQFILPELNEVIRVQQELVKELGRPVIDEKTKEEVHGMMEIPNGTPQAVDYAKRFGEVLSKEVDLPLVQSSFAELVAFLGTKKELEITDDVLVLTEPFFAKPE